MKHNHALTVLYIITLPVPWFGHKMWSTDQKIEKNSPVTRMVQLSVNDSLLRLPPLPVMRCYTVHINKIKVSSVVQILAKRGCSNVAFGGLIWFLLGKY